MPARLQTSRLEFIDWTRGLAAIVMLLGHVFHSFTSKDLRDSGPYVLSQFLGGMPPAIFLFLTGVTLAFLMDRNERKGLAAGARIRGALQRAGYLLALAFAFRIQLWIFAWGQSPWTDLLRVDILNVMGVAIAVLAVMAAFQTAERVRLCAVLGLSIAAVAPLVSQLNWSATPAVIRQYVAPDASVFSFFPWASFLAFGVSFGSILRLVERKHMYRTIEWSALAGIGLILAGQSFSNTPYSVYAQSEFWLDSPALVAIKLGVILLVLAFAYLWTHYASAGWSWVRQLGTTSLLVYWVHTELVYGRWFGGWKESLSLGQTWAAAAAVIGAMVALSWAKTRWRQWRGIGGYPSPETTRAGAD